MIKVGTGRRKIPRDTGGLPVFYSTNFDGSAYLSRGAGLTGAADTTTGLHFLVFRVLGGAGTIRILTQTTGPQLTPQIHLALDNLVTVSFKSALGLTVFSATNSTAITDTNWHSLLIAIDAAQSTKCKVYFDGVDETTSASVTNAAIDYTVPDWFIGANIVGAQTANVDTAVYYLSTEFLDITTEANLRKFVTARGGIADLGPNGERPTGTRPIVFQRNPFSSFEKNLGTGGDFTVTGTLTAGATRPPV